MSLYQASWKNDNELHAPKEATTVMYCKQKTRKHTTRMIRRLHQQSPEGYPYGCKQLEIDPSIPGWTDCCCTATEKFVVVTNGFTSEQIAELTEKLANYELRTVR